MRFLFYFFYMSHADIKICFHVFHVQRTFPLLYDPKDKPFSPFLASWKSCAISVRNKPIKMQFPFIKNTSHFVLFLTNKAYRCRTKI